MVGLSQRPQELAVRICLQLAETKDVTDILGWSQERENGNRNGVG